VTDNSFVLELEQSALKQLIDLGIPISLESAETYRGTRPNLPVPLDYGDLEVGFPNAVEAENALDTILKAESTWK